MASDSDGGGMGSSIVYPLGVAGDAEVKGMVLLESAVCGGCLSGSKNPKALRMNGRRSSWLVFMVLTRVVCYS